MFRFVCEVVATVGGVRAVYVDWIGWRRGYAVLVQRQQDAEYRG
jgi:hypothetical protein